MIDFIEKQPKEFSIFLEEKKKDNESCGIFYNYQLNNDTNKSKQIKTQFFKYIPSYFQNNGITLAIFSFILFLIGCLIQKESYTMTIGIVIVDTTKNNYYTLGTSRFNNLDCSTINLIDSSNSKKSKSI